MHHCTHTEEGDHCYSCQHCRYTLSFQLNIESFRRETLQEFLWSMRTEEASFRMHEGGEVDIRGVYCAVSVARLTNISTEGLFAGTPHWIMR